MLRPATQEERAALAAQGAAVGQGGLLVADGPSGVAAWAAWSPQPFEAEHLGIASARVAAFGLVDPTRGPAEFVRRLFAALAEAGMDFVTIRIAEAESALAEGLAAVGAVEIERLVSFVRDLPAAPAALPAGIRLGNAADAEACAEIGRTAFRFDRFHQDSRLDDAGADSLKAAWMRNAAMGRADSMLVAVAADGRVVGCNACLYRGEQAVIDLIGVLPTAQGRGWGRRLVEAAAAHYAGRARTLLVGTQDSNAASVALYRACGFRPVDTKITFHVHLRDLP